MMICLICWISSLEEAELHGQDCLKNCDFIFILMLSLSVFILLCHFDKTGLYVSAFSICYLIVIDLNLMLSFSIFAISL